MSRGQATWRVSAGLAVSKDTQAHWYAHRAGCLRAFSADMRHGRADTRLVMAASHAPTSTSVLPRLPTPKVTLRDRRQHGSCRVGTALDLARA